MRPVNLIPLEERRGDRAPSRTGRVPYMLVGALALAVAAVAALVMTGNQVKDREAEVASLQARETAAQERANALRPYADFAAMATARDETVTSLATSRFDWERVLRELAIVMPTDIWLSEASATVAPDVALEDAVSIEERSGIAGPALSMIGCGSDQEAVARFIAALEDIDGVTRVGLTSSERPEPDTLSGGGDESDCRTRDFIARFEIVVAFDGAPVTATSTEGAVPATPAPATTTETTATTGTDAADSGVADTQAQEQQVRDSTSDQVGKARDAAGLAGVDK